MQHGTMTMDLRTSESCDSEMSARTLAAGCTMSSSFMMVAPSLLIVTLPCMQDAASDQLASHGPLAEPMQLKIPKQTC